MPAIISWIDLKRRKSPRPNIALNGNIKAAQWEGPGCVRASPLFREIKRKHVPKLKVLHLISFLILLSLLSTIGNNRVE